MSLSDEHLMTKVKAGDVEKLALLFERYQQELYNFFLKFSRDTASSADLTQNVFYRILKYKSSYREQEKFRTWMYKIARNARIDHYHHQRVEMSSESLENQILSDHGKDQKRMEDAEQLQQAAAMMSAEKRELVVMAAYMDMPTAEIAGILEISENNARVRIHRALKELGANYQKIQRYDGRAI